MRVTDEVAAKWAQYRADDAGLAARDLLNCREQLRRVCEAVEVVKVAMKSTEDGGVLDCTPYMDSLFAAILAARKALGGAR